MPSEKTSLDACTASSFDLLRRHVGRRAHHDAERGAARRMSASASAGSVGWIAFAMPKSSTFTTSRRTGAVIMFAGFRSRWTMPFSCAAASASARAAAISRKRASGNPCSRQDAVERLPLDQLHRQEMHVRRFVFFNRVDRDDARAIEGGEDLGLTLESREAVGVAGDVGRQHLQRDVAAELGVAGAIDLAHSASAQLGEDFVVAEGLADHGRGLAEAITRQTQTWGAMR